MDMSPDERTRYDFHQVAHRHLFGGTRLVTAEQIAAHDCLFQDAFLFEAEQIRVCLEYLKDRDLVAAWRRAHGIDPASPVTAAQRLQASRMRSGEPHVALCLDYMDGRRLLVDVTVPGESLLAGVRELAAVPAQPAATDPIVARTMVAVLNELAAALEPPADRATAPRNARGAS